VTPPLVVGVEFAADRFCSVNSLLRFARVGGSWRTDLPAVVVWIEAEDRSSAIDAADRRWREAMRRYWREVQQRPSDQA
jgi:hypothetical protein